MKKLIFILAIIVFISSGCISNKMTKTFDFLSESNLKNKSLAEIMQVLEINPEDVSGNILFVDEPPCSLSSIDLYSKKYNKYVFLRINSLSNDLVFSQTCKWKIQEYLNYIPSTIKISEIERRSPFD